MYAKLKSETKLDVFNGKIIIGNKTIYTNEKNGELLKSYGYYPVKNEKPTPTSADVIVVFERYVIEDSEIVAKYKEEPRSYEPTDYDKLEAQVTYTAMMTDTLLEG